MAWANAWSVPVFCKVTVKSTTHPTDTYSFDDVPVDNGNYTSPDSVVSAFNAILDIAGLSATSEGAIRTIKEGAL